MDKGQILKGLKEVQEKIDEAKKQLEDLVSEPIWSEVVWSELDNSVEVLQELNEKINDLAAIQRDIMTKSSK